MNDSFYNTLRYSLPKTDKEGIAFLAKILNIPAHYLKGNEQRIIQALAATILYRELDRLQKIEAMRLIRSLSHPQLISILISRCTDVLVKPQWGEWSLTNEELREILQFHGSINLISSRVGGNPGAYGVGGAAWAIIKEGSKAEKGTPLKERVKIGATPKRVGALIVSIILMGLHEFSLSETTKYANELERRAHYK